MRYLVPQFISREIKVVGPMSFRQVLFVGGGVGIGFLLYFTLASKNFMLFLFLTIVVMGISFSFAFGKYQGMSLAKVAVNFVQHLLGGSKYLWKKKAVISQAYTPPQLKESGEEEVPMPVTRESQLEDLSSRLGSHKV